MGFTAESGADAYVVAAMFAQNADNFYFGIHTERIVTFTLSPIRILKDTWYGCMMLWDVANSISKGVLFDSNLAQVGFTLNLPLATPGNAYISHVGITGGGYAIEAGKFTHWDSLILSYSGAWPIGPGIDTIVGSTCWGHVTGVTETNVRTFTTNWTGTAQIINSGDTEAVRLYSGTYLESEVVAVSGTIAFTRDKYTAGSGSITSKYKTGTTEANCLADSWHTFTTSFTSTGYIQIRIEA